MKKMTFAFMLSFSAFAGLNDAESLEQIASNHWRVTCLDGTRETVTTEQILNNDVCDQSPQYDSCVSAATSALPAVLSRPVQKAQRVLVSV